MIGGKRQRTRQLTARARDAIDYTHLSVLINSLTDAVFGMDAEGRITVYNAAALNLLDTNEKMSGRHISDVVKLTTVDHQAVDIFAELRRSPSIRKRDDLIMRDEQGDALRLEITFSPVQHSAGMMPDAYVLILRDITKAKSLEEERDEFISVVSHELRTPIAIAEGSLDNARLLASQGYGEKTQEALAEAHHQIMFLAKMVNDLSTLSRAERGVADTPERIDVTELARQLHEEFSPQAAEKGLAFNLDVDSGQLFVYKSRLYLYELLQNFITNAIKYTPDGSITLSIKAQGDDTLCFAVKDSGIGISKSDLAHVFDKFYRAEDYRTRETSGTGLGLYVATKLARKLHCRIEVKSRLNHGSTFYFTLPVAKKRQGL